MIYNVVLYGSVWYSITMIRQQINTTTDMPNNGMGKIDKDIRKKVQKPNRLLYWIATVYARRWIFPRRNVRLIGCQCMADATQPFVVLSNHVNKSDYLYIGGACGRHAINFVGSHYEMYNKRLRWLVKKLGIIPKFLHQTDINATMEMIRIVREGGNLGIFPEGALTSDGNTLPYSKGTGRFLQKLGVQVFVVNIRGAFTFKPKYASKCNRCNIEVEVVGRLSPDELATLDIASIDSCIEQWLGYSESQWIAHQPYALPSQDGFALGMHNALYRCPVCDSLYSMATDSNNIYCTHCNATASVDGHLQLHSDSIAFDTMPQWWSYQQQRIAQDIDSDIELVASNAQLYTKDANTPRVDWRVKVGYGRVWLTSKGLYYHGSNNGQQWQWHVPIANLPAITYRSGQYIEVQYGSQYYHFALDNGQSAAHFANAIEQCNRQLVADK